MAALASPRPRVPSAFDRAVAAGNWPARRPDGLYVIASSSRPEHDHVLMDGPAGLTCSCEAGRYGEPECHHRAALRWCLLHGIIGRWCLCGWCGLARVTKEGALYPGCRSLVSVAQQNDARLAANPLEDLFN